MDGFAQVYQAYYDRVYRFLLSLTGDTHQAEELTQDNAARITPWASRSPGL